MFVGTSLIKQDAVKMAIRKETAVNATSETDAVQACDSLAKLEKRMDELDAYILRHPEREYPVQKILIAYPDELQGRVEPKEFFVSMHDLVVGLIPDGCIIGSIQSYNKNITIYVDGRPVIYHMYMEIYILSPQDVDSSFDMNLERVITANINETIARVYAEETREVVFGLLDEWWGLNQERVFALLDAWALSRGINSRQRPDPGDMYEDFEK